MPIESGRESRQEGKEGKDKWWNLTSRGRKDTGGTDKDTDGGVLGFVRRGKCECISFLSSSYFFHVLFSFPY
jgi:hypothetical protein